MRTGNLGVALQRLTVLAVDGGVPLWVALAGTGASFVLGLLTWWVRRSEVFGSHEDRDQDRELEEIKEALRAWREMVRAQAAQLTSQTGRIDAMSQRLDTATARHRHCEADLLRMRTALEKMGVPMDELVPMRRAEDHHPGSED